MSKPTLYEDSRWPQFKDQYGANLSAFAEDVCGIELEVGLPMIHSRMRKPGTCMVISDVINMRDARLAAVALWALLFHPRNEVVVIAPRVAIHKCHWAIYKNAVSGSHQWLAEYLRISQAGVRTDAGYDGPRITFRTAINHSPENLAGLSGSRLLFLIEGAKSIGDSCMRVLSASLATPLASEVIAQQSFIVVQTQG